MAVRKPIMITDRGVLSCICIGTCTVCLIVILGSWKYLLNQELVQPFIGGFKGGQHPPNVTFAHPGVS